MYTDKKEKIIEFPGADIPSKGGGALHLTFAAHFQTQMSYSSQNHV